MLGTSRRFAVFDIDGTLVRWQLYHAVVDALGKQGLITPSDYAAIKNARMAWKRREHSQSFVEYQKQLVSIFEVILRKITTKEFDSAVDKIFNEYKDQVYTYTRDLIKNLRQRGYLLFAISASQFEIVEKIARHYGFDDFIGSHYERIDGKFSGKVEVPLGQKDKILKNLVKKHAATFKASVGVGDSESDVAMLNLVEQPIAFNPTKELFEYARK